MTGERQETAKVIDFFGSQRQILFTNDLKYSTCATKQIEMQKSVEIPPKKNALSFEESCRQIKDIEDKRKSEINKNDKSISHYLISCITIFSLIYSAFMI